MNYCQFRNEFIKRMAVAGGGGLLPREYQQVEYLESTGAQVIDLGSLWLGGTQSEAELSISANYTFANSSFLFGHFTQGAGGYSLAFPSATSIRVPNGNNLSNYTIPNVTTTKHNITYKPNQLIFDSSTFNLTAPSINNGTLYLFGRNDGYKTAGVRIYRYKRYNTTNSTYTHDLIPCYRKADGITGMYNLINSTFIPYSGTANFIVGNPV